MKRIQHYQNNQPTLYLIPTPIGNLEDMTFRAIRILKEVDVVYAEDTRNTRKLMSYYEIKTPLDSYHDFNETTKMAVLIQHLEQGQNIGLVSDAGMPLISDPGFHLVQSVIDLGYNVVALPGANALLPALAMSGLKAQPFVFIGFLDSKAKKRREAIESYQYYRETLIIYESIHRIHQTLKDLYDVLGDRHFVILREISKAYEELIDGHLSEFNDLTELKGELVLIVDGYHEEAIDQSLSIVEQVDYFIAGGLKKTAAMKKVSLMTNKPKNQIYQEYLKEKMKED